MAKKRKDPTSTTKNLKLKLYLNNNQINLIKRDERNAKWVWNLCLQQRKEYWTKCETFGPLSYKEIVEGPSENDQMAELTQVKKLGPFTA